jgi:hypothetical protein
MSEIRAHKKDMESRVTILEVQVGRLTSDVESEKATRARSNADLIARFDKLDDRLRISEKWIAMGAGAIALLQIISWFKN